MRAHRFTLTDCFACVLIVLFAAGVLLSKDQLINETKARIKCASNLRQIGQAMLLYANENRQSYPRSLADKKDANPKPTWGTPYEGDKQLGPMTGADAFCKDTDPAAKVRPALHDVTAASFLLLRTQDITAGVFTCPSAQRRPFDFGGGTHTAQDWTNWPGNAGLLAHLSYSMQNPYVGPSVIKKGFKWSPMMDANFVLAADINPGVDGLLKLTLQSPADELRKGNSVNHNQDGQNVLCGDGHVEFQNQPFAGVNRDNIYTFGRTGQDNPNTGGDGIAGASVSPDDTVLLPTSVGVGDTNPLLNPEGL
jgi:hypothetical protein